MGWNLSGVGMSGMFVDGRYFVWGLKIIFALMQIWYC